MRLIPFLVLVLAGCGTDVRGRASDDSSDDADSDLGGPDGGTSTTVADARVPPPDGIPPNLAPCEEAVFHSDFAWVQRTVFDVSCTDAGCHGGAFPRGDLDLRSGVSYSQLVNAPSHHRGWIRVVPGSSPQSMLMLQIGGEPGVSPDELMPLDAPRLCEPQIEAIRRWIVSGARND